MYDKFTRFSRPYFPYFLYKGLLFRIKAARKWPPRPIFTSFLAKKRFLGTFYDNFTTCSRPYFPYFLYKGLTFRIKAARKRPPRPIFNFCCLEAIFIIIKAIKVAIKAYI